MYADLVTRLQQVAELKSVGAELDLAAIAEKPIPATPAAFVVPVDMQAAANHRVGGVLQTVNEGFGVVLILRSSARGTIKATDFETVRKAIFNSLLGYQPAGTVNPITFSKGNLVEIAPNEFRYLLQFNTAFMQKGNP